MNETELRLAETLIHTGRLRPEELQGCLDRKTDGEGLIDSLVRQGTVRTAELEAALSELKPAEVDSPADVVRRLERYVLLNELGKGGMGRVYLAYDTKLKRSVALKVMRAIDPEDAGRFQRELEIAAKLEHPNIAATYDAHSVEGTFVIAMQYIDGHSLDCMRPAPREAAESVAQAARAVSHAHEKGIIHRDLKPENIMRTKEGRIYVLDFGIARTIDKGVALTHTGAIVGTPAFMSPEQARGKALDARTDVYSLGATLYALLGQRLPFEGASVLDVLEQATSQEPVSLRKLNTRIHRDLETIVQKAMNKNPEGRYATMREIADDLDRFLAGEPILARPISTIAKAGRLIRKKPWAVATIVAVALGLGVASGIWWRESRKGAQLSEASAKAEEAARKLHEWDRLLYLPPRDLTSHRILLEDAVRLCDESLEKSDRKTVSAHYHKARALLRLGREEEAEVALTAAILSRPDGLFYLERARIRLHRLTRKMAGTGQLLSMEFSPGNKAMKRLISEPDRAAILEDLAEARRRGRDAEFERTYMELVEHALRDDFDSAIRAGEHLLARAEPLEQAEVHRLLAWVSYLAFRAAQEKRKVEDFQLPPHPYLKRAVEHVSAAIAVRESDSDLYQFRAFLALAQTEEPMGYLYSVEAPADFQRLSQKIRESEKPLRDFCRRATEEAEADADIALRIRPGDPDSLLLRSNRYMGRLSPTEFMEVFDRTIFAASSEEGERQIARIVEIGKRWEEDSLRPYEAEVRHVLELCPAHPVAWAHLGILHFMRAYFGLFGGDLKSNEVAIATISRCLEVGPDPSLTASMLTFRIILRGWIFLRGGGKDDSMKKAGLEDLERLRSLDPKEAEELSEMFSAREP